MAEARGVRGCCDGQFQRPWWRQQSAWATQPSMPMRILPVLVGDGSLILAQRRVLVYSLEEAPIDQQSVGLLQQQKMTMGRQVLVTTMKRSQHNN